MRHPPLPGDPPPTEEQLKAQGIPRKCTCSRSRCLQSYCICFSHERYCVDCACVNCQNTPRNEEAVMQAKQTARFRDPNAFLPKFNPESPIGHKKGCKCKSSGCRKGYCECYGAGIPCGPNCRCEGCKNDPTLVSTTRPKVPKEFTILPNADSTIHIESIRLPEWLQEVLHKPACPLPSSFNEEGVPPTLHFLRAILDAQKIREISVKMMWRARVATEKYLKEKGHSIALPSMNHDDNHSNNNPHHRFHIISMSLSDSPDQNSKLNEGTHEEMAINDLLASSITHSNNPNSNNSGNQHYNHINTYLSPQEKEEILQLQEASILQTMKEELKDILHMMDLMPPNYMAETGSETDSYSSGYSTGSGEESGEYSSRSSSRTPKDREYSGDEQDYDKEGSLNSKITLDSSKVDESEEGELSASTPEVPTSMEIAHLSAPEQHQKESSDISENYKSDRMEID